ELYRKEGAWKFRALGQGFDGELPDLAKHFGF
ncbi:MAG: TerD family protein, partial [Thermoguttaceae bacterium]|nr:TerD family protein [Thermoguttaceae bacterium]